MSNTSQSIETTTQMRDAEIARLRAELAAVEPGPAASNPGGRWVVWWKWHDGEPRNTNIVGTKECAEAYAAILNHSHPTFRHWIEPVSPKNTK